METTVWIPILSGLGGFVIAVAALPLKTLSATTKAAESMSKIYKDTVLRLEGDVKDLQKESAEHKAEIEELRSKRCDRVACKNRIPPKSDEQIENNN